MAEIPGYSGDVTFTSFQTTCKSFVIEHVCDLEDVTAFDASVSGVKIYAPTLKDWTATLEMNYSTANNQTPGTSALLTLTVDATSYYNGSAFLQSMTVNEAVDGIVTQTGVFQGTGLLSLS